MLLGSLVLLLIAAAAIEGRYEGKWSSTAGSGNGDIRIAVLPGEGGWKGEAMFTMDGSEVPCKVVRLELNETKVVIAYQFNLAGYSLVSTLTGEAKGDSISGKYETKTSDGSQQIDAGSWSASKK